MWASGHVIWVHMYILMQFRLSAQVATCITYYAIVGGQLYHLNAVVCKFLSERGVQVHPLPTGLGKCNVYVLCMLRNIILERSVCIHDPNAMI